MTILFSCYSIRFFILTRSLLLGSIVGSQERYEIKDSLSLETPTTNPDIDLPQVRCVPTSPFVYSGSGGGQRMDIGGTRSSVGGLSVFETGSYNRWLIPGE